MIGKVISINMNEPTFGKLSTATGELDVYKLPKTIKVGDKIKYSSRISRVGNLYAVYLSPYQQINIIDFEKRMTSMEYLVLYYYHLIKENERTDYSDQTFKKWILTEELIENYNLDTEDIKQDAAELSDKSFDMFNTMFTAERWNYEKPVIWKDREKTPYFIEQLTESHRFEVFVDTLFSQHGFDIGLYYGREQQYSGETRVGIEIKLDKKLKETKNVYIEYQERMRKSGMWVNSGILKSDNTKMIFIGDIDKYYILGKERLLEYYNSVVLNKESINGIRVVAEKEHGTSKGFIMNERLAMQENISVDNAIDILRG